MNFIRDYRVRFKKNGHRFSVPIYGARSEEEAVARARNAVKRGGNKTVENPDLVCVELLSDNRIT